MRGTIYDRAVAAKTSKKPASKTKTKPKPKPKTKTKPKTSAAKPKPATRADLGKPVDGYFKNAPAAHKPILDKLRGLIESELPDATSSIKWGNPFYEVAGKMTVAISAHKAHVNLILSGDAKAFDDPDGALEGESKLGRHLKVTQLDGMPSDARIRGWIRTAAALARG